MASYTTNLNLNKPAGSENVAIGDINNNMDIIDQAVGTLNSKTTGKVVNNTTEEITFDNDGIGNLNYTANKVVSIISNETSEYFFMFRRKVDGTCLVYCYNFELVKQTNKTISVRVWYVD